MGVDHLVVYCWFRPARCMPAAANMIRFSRIYLSYVGKILDSSPNCFIFDANKASRGKAERGKHTSPHHQDIWIYINVILIDT